MKDLEFHLLDTGHFALEEDHDGTWIANELPFLQDYELAGCDDDAVPEYVAPSVSRGQYGEQ